MNRGLVERPIARQPSFALAPVVALFVAEALLLGTSGCKRTPSDERATADGANARTPLKVAAAADLSGAFREIGEAYEKTTGQKVVFSFGSTGLLAKQIEEGAPFDVFAAANASFTRQVVDRGACLGDSLSLYARGRIVVFTKRGVVKPPTSLSDLRDGRFTKIAIAQPEHAPYGKAAKEALAAAGIWEAVSPRIVYGENVLQALQFAKSGNAEASIVALSLATLERDDAEVLPIDPALYEPLDQTLVVCQGDRRDALARIADAKAFASYVNSEPGRAVMRRYGFLLPGETSPQQ